MRAIGEPSGANRVRNTSYLCFQKDTYSVIGCNRGLIRGLFIVVIHV